MNIHKGQSGVTLLELLVVIVIAGILAAAAIPSLSNFVRDNKLTSARMQFVSDLNLARGEAIKRNSRVLICSGTVAGCINSPDWAATGWLVCYDMNADGVCDAPLDANNPNPILVRNPIRESNTGVVFNGPAVPLFYNPVGTQGAAGNAGVQFNISGNWQSYTGQRVVAVASTGNITSH